MLENLVMNEITNEGSDQEGCLASMVVLGALGIVAVLFIVAVIVFD